MPTYDLATISPHKIPRRFTLPDPFFCLLLILSSSFLIWQYTPTWQHFIPILLIGLLALAISFTTALQSHRNQSIEKSNYLYGILTAGHYGVFLLASVLFIAETHRRSLASAINIVLFEHLLLLLPLTTVFFPFLTRAFVQSRINGLRRLQKTLPFLLILTFFIAALAVIFSPRIADFFYPNRSVEVWHFLTALSPVLFFTVMNQLFGQQVLFQLRQPQIFVRFQLLSLALNIFLPFLFTLWLPPAAAALSFPLAEAIVFGSYLFFISGQKPPLLDFFQFHPRLVVNNIIYIISERISRRDPPRKGIYRVLNHFRIDCVWQIDTTEKVLYLSFDDGPDPEVTPYVLDLLRTYNAKATFFCIGEKARSHPELLDAIRAEGHSLGNHTFSHIDGWKTGRASYLADVEAASRHINSPLFRPPYGHISRFRANKLRSARYGLRTILWSVVSSDVDTSISPQQCFENVRVKAQPGSIVLFHDIIESLPNLRHALPDVLTYFSEQGYRFCAIPLNI